MRLAWVRGLYLKLECGRLKVKNKDSLRVFVGFGS